MTSGVFNLVVQPSRLPQNFEKPYRATPTISRAPVVAMPDINLPEPSVLRSRTPYHHLFVSRFTQALGLLTETVRQLQSERGVERTVSFSAARGSLLPTMNALPNLLKDALSDLLDQEFLAHSQSSTTGVRDIAGNLAIGISSIVGTSIPFAGATIVGELVANGSLVCFKKVDSSTHKTRCHR